MCDLKARVVAVLALEPSAPALEFERCWTSWGDLRDGARAINAAIDALGLGADTRVGVLLRNRAPLAPAIIATVLADRCLTTLNANAPDDRLAADIRKVAAPVLLGLAEDWERADIRAAALDVGAAGFMLSPGFAISPVAGVPGDQSLWTNRDAPGVAIEMLTSGTTGTPKRIPLSRTKFEKSLLGMAAYEKGRAANDSPRLRGGVQIITAPFAHIAGVTHVMNNVLAGRKICLLEKFSVEAFRDAVVRHRPKIAGAPPSAVRMILDANVPKEDLSSLAAFRTGTAPLEPDLAEAFHERYGIPVLQNYGATEFAGGIAGWTLDDFNKYWVSKRGSVGRLNPGAQARVVDPETGKAKATGEDGLIELRGPNIGDGQSYVRTMDIGAVDEDGFLYVKGRFDNAIIRGGFKILPDDIVRAMEQHPAIREAAVASLPDRRLGRVPVAAYIVKSGAEPPTQSALIAFLRERLMPYQTPVRLLRVEEMPRTPSMKVSQPALLALFESVHTGTS